MFKLRDLITERNTLAALTKFKSNCMTFYVNAGLVIAKRGVKSFSDGLPIWHLACRFGI